MFPHQIIIKHVPTLHRLIIAKQIANIAIDHMPAQFQQSLIRLRFMPPEPGPPDPRLSASHIGRFHHLTFHSMELKIMEFVTMPLAGFSRKFGEEKSRNTE